MGIGPGRSVVCAGILVADLFVPPLPSLPAAGELLATEDFIIQPGGCAANTAICLARLGVSAAVIGTVGDDLFGDFLQRDLRERGIDTTGVARSRRLGTSKTVVIPVAGEDRRFIHTFGANAALRAEDIDPAIVARAEVLYVGGYLVLPALEQAALAERFRLAQESGVRTVLDVVVPAGEAGVSLDLVRELLPHVELFLPNEDEARALTGEQDPHRAAERLLEAGAETAIVTRGRHGALLLSGEESLELPAPRVETVDGSGAGDAFAAGFIAGLLEGWSAQRCLQFASVLGASACTALGCTAGVFTRAEAEAFLEAQPLAVRADPRPTGS